MTVAQFHSRFHGSRIIAVILITIMILPVLAGLSLLRTLENLNELAPPIQVAGPVGRELEAVQDLQSRVANIMWNEHAKGPSTMLRWLRAKKLDVNGAEKMIRAHVQWRKDLNIDKLRFTEANPKFLKRFWYNITGHSKNGNPIMLLPFGDWDIRGYLNDGGNRENFDRHQGQMWEKSLHAVEQVEIKAIKMRKPRKEPVQYIMLCDMDNLAYSQLASVQSLQYILSMVFNFENNYPEVVYYCYLINSDWVVETLLRLIRPFMQGSIEKLKVYGKDRQKWEKVVRRLIDPKDIPYRYGGYSAADRSKHGLPPRPDHT